MPNFIEFGQVVASPGQVEDFAVADKQIDIKSVVILAGAAVDLIPSQRGRDCTVKDILRDTCTIRWDYTWHPDYGLTSRCPCASHAEHGVTSRR